MKSINLNYKQLKAMNTTGWIELDMPLKQSQALKIGQELAVKEKWASVEMTTLVEDGEQSNSCYIYQAEYGDTATVDVEGVKYRWRAASTMPSELVRNKVWVSKLWCWQTDDGVLVELEAVK